MEGLIKLNDQLFEDLVKECMPVSFAILDFFDPLDEFFPPLGQAVDNADELFVLLNSF